MMDLEAVMNQGSVKMDNESPIPLLTTLLQLEPGPNFIKIIKPTVEAKAQPKPRPRGRGKRLVK
jgi:hypothetical protein